MFWHLIAKFEKYSGFNSFQFSLQNTLQRVQHNVIIIIFYTTYGPSLCAMCVGPWERVNIRLLITFDKFILEHMCFCIFCLIFSDIKILMTVGHDVTTFRPNFGPLMRVQPWYTAISQYSHAKDAIKPKNRDFIKYGNSECAYHIA